jgi:outer membrane receptor protein involved in Fe transport
MVASRPLPMALAPVGLTSDDAFEQGVSMAKVDKRRREEEESNLIEKVSTMALHSAGAAFRQAVQEESPLQVIGAINANHALLAKRAGFRAIYLSGGGVLSANLFHRQITDLIRYTVAQQSSPSWAPGQDRWVSSPLNLGDATTQGIELEAKFRLDQLRAGALPVDIRSNLSLFSSRVKQVPGPDNRLDQQPGMTANLGADYRVRSIPLTVGGNLNWNPDYDTRRSEQQWAYQGTKRVLDVYGQWRFSPATALRLTVSNFTSRDYLTSSTYTGNGVSETSRNTSPSWRNVQLRLEMKI